MPAKKRKHNPVAGTPRRRSPSSGTLLSNPGGAGIGAIVMNGFWIFAGMWAGGLIGGVIAPIVGPLTGALGPFGGIANGLITAYAVGWLGSRVGGHGMLMAAGAFAPSIGGAVTGLIGGGASLFGGGGGGGNALPVGGATPVAPSPPTVQPAPPTPTPMIMGTPSPPINQTGRGANVFQMPIARAQG